MDSVGIRLPKYKVRELTLELQRAGELQDDTVDKMMFLQVNVYFLNVCGPLNSKGFLSFILLFGQTNKLISHRGVCLSNLSCSA